MLSGAYGTDTSNSQADLDKGLLDLTNFTPRSTPSPLPRRVPVPDDDILKGIEAFICCHHHMLPEKLLLSTLLAIFLKKVDVQY